MYPCCNETKACTEKKTGDIRILILHAKEKCKDRIRQGKHLSLLMKCHQSKKEFKPQKFNRTLVCS